LPVFYGDASRQDVLRRLGGERAAAVVVTLTTTGQAVDRTVAYLQSRFPELPVYARARDAVHARRLEELGAEGTVLETLEASLQLGGAVLRRTGTDWQDIEELIRQLRFVDGIADSIGVRPPGDGGGAEVPTDRVLAAAMIAEEAERAEVEEAERAEAVEADRADAEPDTPPDRDDDGRAPGVGRTSADSVPTAPVEAAGRRGPSRAGGRSAAGSAP
jgi:CPA2 family monovalent cation:H+ antiporter-2